MLVAFVAGAAGRAARCAAGAVVQAARRRRARRATAARAGSRRGARRVGHGHLVPAHRQHARAAPLPRQGHDRARVARRAAAGVDRDDRAPGAARVSRSARGAAQPGVRAGPHVHVAVLHLRVDPAAGRDGRAADVDPPGARAAGGVRAADRAHLDVAARASSAAPGARRAGEPAGAAPVHARHHRAAGQGSARHRHRRRLVSGAARGVGALVRAGRARRAGRRRLAHAGLGDLRRGVRRRGRVRVVGARRAGGRRAAGAGGRIAAVGVHRRDSRRNRLPARHLAGRLAASGVARRLRGLAAVARPTSRRPRASPRASASSTSRSPIPAPSGSCSTT